MCVMIVFYSKVASHSHCKCVPTLKVCSKMFVYLCCVCIIIATSLYVGVVLVTF